MRNMLLIITVFSLSFCGTVYFSYDMDASVDIEGFGSGDWDDGAIMIGYNHDVHTSDNMGIAIGFNYAVSPWSGDGDPGDDDFEFTSYTLYGMMKYGLSETMYMFGSLGYGFASDDNDVFGSTIDVNAGLAYGLGFGYKVSDTWSVGFGYNMNNYELEDVTGGTADVEVDRTFLYGAYTF